MIGAFGGHTFVASSKKILTPSNTSTKEELDYEMQARTGKKPATYVKGQSEMNIQFTLHLDRRFLDPIAEHSWWIKAMRTVSKQQLSLYNHLWGTGKFIVVSVERENDVARGDGVLMSCDLQIKLAEWVAEGTASSSTSTVSSAATAKTGTLNAADVKASAVKAAESTTIKTTASATRGTVSKTVKIIITMLDTVAAGCAVTVAWKAPDGHTSTRTVRETTSMDVVKGSTGMLTWSGRHDYYAFGGYRYSPQTSKGDSGKKQFIAAQDVELKIYWTNTVGGGGGRL